MDFYVLMTVLVMATCAMHVQASPYAPSDIAEQDLENLLNKLKASLMLKEQEVIHQEAAKTMQMRRRCASSTRNKIRINETSFFTLECCLLNGMLCLNPDLNVPEACVVDLDNCTSIVWRLSWWKSYTFKLCKEAVKNTPCLRGSPLRKCSSDLMSKANTASVVLCHDEEDGTETCTSDGDVDSDLALSQLSEESCFCIGGDLGLPVCNPKGCNPFTAP